MIHHLLVDIKSAIGGWGEAFLDLNYDDNLTVTTEKETFSMISFSTPDWQRPGVWKLVCDDLMWFVSLLMDHTHALD